MTNEKRKRSNPLLYSKCCAVYAVYSRWELNVFSKSYSEGPSCLVLRSMRSYSQSFFGAEIQPKSWFSGNLVFSLVFNWFSDFSLALFKDVFKEATENQEIKTELNNIFKNIGLMHLKCILV